MDLVRRTATALKRFAVRELVRIARCGNQPIGFLVAMPDYNQVLAKMNGRLFPTGWLTFLRMRRKIDAIHVFIAFVIPEYQRKRVIEALYYAVAREALARGYTWGEGSTVLETNLPMRKENERLGGVHRRTYRIYRKQIS